MEHMSSAPELNHLVLYATDIAKTAAFYHNLLGIAVSEIEYMQHETISTHLAKYALGSLPQPILGFLKPTISTHLKAISTQICYLRTTGDAPLLVLMAEEDHETKEKIPVSGNTIYKTSWLLSPKVDEETLAWDLSESKIWFMWADIGSDGRVYTPELEHSLFLKDPDGRLVELIPNHDNTEQTPIVSKFTKRTSKLLYPTIYSDNLNAWGTFMNNAFKIKEADGAVYKHDSGAISEIISWKSSRSEWPLLAVICEINPDGKKTAYGGYGLNHIAYTGSKEEIGAACKNAEPVINHKPLRPDKSYEYHLCQGPDGVSFEYMTEA